jgi:DNA replication protein DnaC
VGPRGPHSPAEHAQPSLDPKQIRELATCRWISNGDALLLLGPPGVGKTHLAVALGREAVRLGFTVLFTSATGLLTTLAKAHAEARLEDRLAFYAKPKLLVIDELGYLPFERACGAAGTPQPRRRRASLLPARLSTV